MSLGQHEYGNRLRSHAGSMGNAEDASRPGVRVFRPETIRYRGTHRPPSRGDERQFAGYNADRTQGPDKRLIQIVGRSGLTSGIRGINNWAWHLPQRLPCPLRPRPVIVLATNKILAHVGENLTRRWQAFGVDMPVRIP